MTLTQKIRAKLYRESKYLRRDISHLLGFHESFFRNARGSRILICLTFDDGYANNHKYVLSLLNQYHLPATFFITAIRDAGYDILWNDFLGITDACHNNPEL